MGWYRDIQKILRDEPEVWLAYLFGQQLENLPHLSGWKKNKRTISGSIVWRTISFLVFILKKATIKNNDKSIASAEFYFYAGTYNQLSSLNATIRSLSDRGKRVSAVTNSSSLLNSGNHVYRIIKFSPSVLMKSVVVYFSRFLFLYKELKAKDYLLPRKYFTNFCIAYPYLIFFYNELNKIKPKFVITANDHNVENRCLIAVANFLKIKTVYMQHASVSPLFPALEVDYAFLDGQASLNTYKLCENNRPSFRRNIRNTVVYLSGQKKDLSKKKLCASVSRVGIALNALDCTSGVVDLVEALNRNGTQVVVRWHPGMKGKIVKVIKSKLQIFDNVVFSNPQVEDVSNFITGLSCLIAGNCSIHLEAALSGVQSIYYETQFSSVHDYYGYVKHGIAENAKTLSEVTLAVNKIIYLEKMPDVQAVRYYSATYGTSWNSREGELVADHLLALSQGSDPKAMFGFARLQSDDCLPEPITEF